MYSCQDSSLTSAPLAVCGLGIRLPGGIRDAAAFWDLLVDGRDARGPISSNRYNVEAYNDTLGNKGVTETPCGYFLDEDLARLDSSFFSMTPHELERMDPQQKQILEITRECLDNAGEIGYQGKIIGCYVGTHGEDWLHMSAKESQYSGRHIPSGYTELTIANRISYEFDLRGPSMVIKTGCSASLVGLHEACTALRMGHCSAAIVAGTNLIMSPATTAPMTQKGILSPEGSCKASDAAADGLAWGEAISAVYVKKLDDAIRDGNPVRAVIRNTGTNSDGKGSNIPEPNGLSHESLMHNVYRGAGLNVDETAFVECDGIGTSIGGSIEATAVGKVFEDKGVFIGSVKSNVGHSEAASGLTSLIKAILALEHEIIPPNIKVNDANPRIPFHEKSFKVPIKAIAWPRDRELRISINSFGTGGVNAHAIIDSGSGIRNDLNDSFKTPERRFSLLLLSANTKYSLEKLIPQSLNYLKLHPERCMDVAYSMARGREHMPYRSFAVIGEGLEQVVPSPVLSAKTPSIVMAFSGQGAQWPEMGVDLLEADVGFRDDIKAMDKVLQTLMHPPGWTIEGELRKPAESSRLYQAEFAQPICAAVQIGLANIFKRYGVHPNAVVGQSSGEIAAAYTCGALSLPAALIVAYYRGRATKTQTENGAMAFVELGMNEVSRLLIDGVVVALENSPGNTVISGDRDKVEEVLEGIKKEMPHISVFLLPISTAYHSHHMKAASRDYIVFMEEEFRKQGLFPRTPSVPFYSSVTGGMITETETETLGSRIWARNLISPVLFSSTVTQVTRDLPNSVFLEIGLHSMLSTPLRTICSKADSPLMYAPAMVRYKTCEESLLSAFGLLYQFGIAFDVAKLFPSGRILTDLPTYPWDHQAAYWYESQASADRRFCKHGYHSLLGLRIMETTDIEPCWRNILNTENEPWLCDHKIHNDVVFPFAGYCAMAGEALRQISGVESGYLVENITTRSALILDESGPNEIVTSLRSCQTLGPSATESWTFTISSRSRSSWTVNCEGFVMPGRKTKPESPGINACLRKLQPSKWYDALADVGLHCGPEFQGLTSISCSTTTNSAKAEILNPKPSKNSAFALHPSAIDACFQLLSIARVRGVCRNLTNLAMPTFIEELEISPGTTEMEAMAWSPDENEASGVQCAADGMTVLRLSGVHFNIMDEKKETKFMSTSAQLEWRPYFDFVNPRSLFTPPRFNKEKTALQEEMTALCIVDSVQCLQGLSAKQPHFDKYSKWLSKEMLRVQPKHEQSSGDIRQLPRATRSAMIEERFNAILSICKNDKIAECTRRIWRNLEDIFTGRMETLDLLMQDNLLTDLYTSHSFDHSNFLQTLSHKKPDLRILEVGAGAGGTTHTFLRDLVHQDGLPIYSLYTFSDISAGFFPKAKERFAFAPNMDFKVLDVSGSPLEQGFEAQTYDLVLAANLIDATPVLQDTLRNLRILLRTDGHLLITELAGSLRVSNYMLGCLPGGWFDEVDGRPETPFIGMDRWDQELKCAGFTGVDTVEYDAPEPYRSCAVIVTRPQPEIRETEQDRPVLVVCDRPDDLIATRLMKSLCDAGYEVSVSELRDNLPPDSDILSILDLECGVLENITCSKFSALQSLIRNHSTQNILWLTLPSQIYCSDPKSAQSIGLARTIRSELAAPMTTLEIDPSEPEFTELAIQVLQKVRAWKGTENNPDREFAVYDGKIHIGRYHPIQLPIGHYSEPILDDHVEVEIFAVGPFNVPSVTKTPAPEDVTCSLGISGYVRSVGAKVENVAVGDKVMAIAPRTDIGTRAVLPASLVVRIPNDLSFEDAVPVSISYGSAIYSLTEIGQLKVGQSVLVNLASAAAADAAIQVCKAAGAEVYAAVSIESDVQCLINRLGLARNNVFHSFADSFVVDVMRNTLGRGVDIVLDLSCAGQLQELWKCLDEGGKMIQVAGRKLTELENLDRQTFTSNRSYTCIDISRLAIEKPDKMRRILEKFVRWYEERQLNTTQSVGNFDKRQRTASLDSYGTGDRIDGAADPIQNQAPKTTTLPDSRDLLLHFEAAYILTGGLGGLGRSVATWLVEHGARALVFLSRSAGSDLENLGFVEELESLGCSVFTVSGEVQNVEDVRRAVAAPCRTIKGVIHLAGVLRDVSFLDMTHADWTNVTRPKVNGAWNLHSALEGHDLDFFFLASSLSSTLGHPDQANHAAACTFLEAFCRYRHSLGLPASVLAIGPIKGVGRVSEDLEATARVASQGLQVLGEREFLESMEVALVNSTPASSSRWPSSMDSCQLIMGLNPQTRTDTSKHRPSWHNDRRLAMYTASTEAVCQGSSSKISDNAWT